MINCSVNRGKYIIKVTPADTVDTIVYAVSVNSMTTIFQGKTSYFGGGFEVDCSDWIEQWINKQTKTGIVHINCTVTVVFSYYTEGSLATTEMKSINYFPDVVDALSPMQSGIICGGANGYPPIIDDTVTNYLATVAIYPIYFFKMRCKIDGVDFFDDNVMFDPTCTTPTLIEPGEKVYRYDTFDDPTNEWTGVKDNLFIHCEPALSLPLAGPKIVFHDDTGKVNCIDFAGLYDILYNMPTIDPFTYTEFADYEESKVWSYNTLLRYAESEFKSNYTSNAKKYIDHIQPNTTYILSVDADHPNIRTMSEISFELTGYGYKTMMLYTNIDGLYPSTYDVGIFTSDYVSCVSMNPDCPVANIILLNSGFAVTTNDTFENIVEFSTVTPTDQVQMSDAPTDIVLPLKVRNGQIVGKTVNNLEKTTYMDRYGDTHNSVMTNSYEIECYIDPEWLIVGTGSDLTYEKLMLACQNAQKTYLASTATISGIESNGSFMLEGRIKDIEHIETYSSYNTNHKIPSYKITFEVYQ